MVAFDLEEIHSLSDFQRNAKRHIVRMKKKRRPLVLTINGKAEMVAVDVKSFQEMLEIIDRVEAVEGIRQGLASKKRGEGKTLEQFDKEMRKKYKIRVLHVRHAARKPLEPKRKK